VGGKRKSFSASLAGRGCHKPWAGLAVS